MEMQYKEKESNMNGVVESKEVEVGKGRRVRRQDLVLRFLALSLTLLAAVVLGVNKQTKIVSLKLIPTLPPVDIPATAKWHHLSAFVYFVVVNAIACSYGAFSIILTLATRGGKRSLSLLVINLDLMMVALLFSAVGATGSVGLIGYQGNSHLQWGKVCNVFDKFCHQAAAAIFLSFVGSIAYLLLVLFAALNLHKKFK